MNVDSTNIDFLIKNLRSHVLDNKFKTVNKMGCSESVTVVSNTKQRGQRSESLANYIEYITDDEKQIIRKNWNILSKDLSGLGVQIFLRIFVLKPDLKQLFPFRNYEGEELVADSVFRGHASRFVQAIGAAIDNMDDLNNAMGPMLEDLGGQHLRYDGFKPEYWDIFIESVLDIWKKQLRRKLTSNASDAWRVLFEFMTSKLKEGYNQACRNARKKRKAQTDLNEGTEKDPNVSCQD